MHQTLTTPFAALFNWKPRPTGFLFPAHQSPAPPGEAAQFQFRPFPNLNSMPDDF